MFLIFVLKLIFIILFPLPFLVFNYCVQHCDESMLHNLCPSFYLFYTVIPRRNIARTKAVGTLPVRRCFSFRPALLKSRQTKAVCFLSKNYRGNWLRHFQGKRQALHLPQPLEHPIRSPSVLVRADGWVCPLSSKAGALPVACHRVCKCSVQEIPVAGIFKIEIIFFPIYSKFFMTYLLLVCFEDNSNFSTYSVSC